ncbi:MAG: hypothetical protein AB7N80_07315 [Bdellovibrionales bacterium]
MKRLCVAFILLGTPYTTFADAYFFAGAGMGYVQSELQLNSTESEFRGSAHFVTAGLSGRGGTGMGGLLKVEAGQGQNLNTLPSSTYMELTKISFMAGKAGLMIGDLTFGGGYRMMDLKIKSLSSSTGMIERSYNEGLPLAFVSYTALSKLFRTEVELQYVTGDVGPIKYQEVSLSLSFSLNLSGM